MTSLLIVGTGGHAKSVLDCALCTGRYDQIAFMARSGSAPIMDFPFFAEETTPLSLIRSQFNEVIVAIGNNEIRMQKILVYSTKDIRLATLIHPAASVSRFAAIGDGSVVLAGAVIGAGAAIGRGCIINSGAVVEHECVLADGVHISPNAALGGQVSIGERAWVCIGSSVINNLSIGQNTIVAAGAAVISDLPANVLAAGVPAVIKKVL